MTMRFLLLLAPATALCQTPPPVRVLPAATSRSTERITSIVDVRHFSDGRVLVNVPDQRRMIGFDSALKTVTVVADTIGTGPLKYPRNFPPLIPFSGDSVLFIDTDSRSFLVIDALGRGARPMAPVKAQDLTTIAQRRAGSAANVDAQGRLIYRANIPSRGRVDGQPVQPAAPADTAPVVRADFSSRQLDTLAYIKIQLLPFTFPTAGPNGKPTATYFVNPVLPPTDDWVVTSEGHVAFVRSSDYHIDWILADGSRISTPKMPFDWRRLSDQDKQARIDSAKHIIDSLRAADKDPYQMTMTTGGVRVDTIHPTIEYAALDKIPDYFPPIRPGSTLADGDGNIWILPSTSSQAGGGLLYDVVNNKGVLFQRVRAPKDRIVIGFGRGGIVYMAALVAPAEWVLERTRLAPPN